MFGALLPGVDRPNRRLFAALLLLLFLGASAADYFLWSDGDPPSAPIRSLAVLPLENLSGDPGQEYFFDGMTEALISELARIEEQLAAELELPEQLLTGESFLEAIRYLQKAISRDSSFAPAYAALALPAGILPWFRTEIPSGLQSVDSLARWAARRAVRLDPSSAEAHLAMAIVRGNLDRNWTAAEQFYRNAIARTPGLAEVRREYAMMLLRTGRFEEALEEARTADRLDPLSPAVKHTLAAIAYCRRRYREATALARASLELRPGQGVAVRWLGEAYLELGEIRRALEQLEKYAAGENPWAWAKLGYAYGRANRPAPARRMLERLGHVQAPSAMRALVHLGLGEHERALDLLEDGMATPSRFDPYIEVHPMYDPLRRNPRYQRMLERVGLDRASIRSAAEQLGGRSG